MGQDRRVLGRILGLLFGSALFVIPGTRALFAAGPLVAWSVGGLEWATLVGGMSALGAGLFSIGVPKDSVLSYETQIKAGKFVVIAHGTRDEVDRPERSSLAPRTTRGAQLLQLTGARRSRLSAVRL